jgi:ADP-ribose pyrophosphatase YjhB (NUDIX family)
MINIKKWFNYDPFESRVKVSAGVIVILRNEKLLLCHPTGHKWIDSFSFPKGGVDVDESTIDAALRELREETSVIVDKSQIENLENPITVNYKNKKGVKYKKVILFIARINSVSDIGLDSDVIQRERLQLEEVDWAGFLTKEDAKIKIFHRFAHLLDLIK